MAARAAVCVKWSDSSPLPRNSTAVAFIVDVWLLCVRQSEPKTNGEVSVTGTIDQPVFFWLEESSANPNHKSVQYSREFAIYFRSSVATR